MVHCSTLDQNLTINSLKAWSKQFGSRNKVENRIREEINLWKTLFLDDSNSY